MTFSCLVRKEWGASMAKPRDSGSQPSGHRRVSSPGPCCMPESELGVSAIDAIIIGDEVSKECTSAGKTWAIPGRTQAVFSAC